MLQSISTHREELASCSGRSTFLVALYIDIRDFSAFCSENESEDVAHFLQSFFLDVLEPHAGGFETCKQLGDGYLFACETAQEIDEDVMLSLVAAAQKIVRAYPDAISDRVSQTICIPELLGAGMACGYVCKLENASGVIDYTGRALNIAARLQDLARPSGVVLDQSILARIPSARSDLKGEEKTVEPKGIGNARSVLHLA